MASASMLRAEIYSGKCDYDLTWSFNTEDGVLTISGTGAMMVRTYDATSEFPWYPYRSSIKSLDIKEGVTTIGNFAFNSYSNLTSANIPNSITSIGNFAFSHCSGLTSVTIPESVTSIGKYAFYGCSSLTSMTIPNSVTSIGYYAFENCSSLTKVNISDLTAWCNISFDDEYANPLCHAKHLFLNDVEITDLVIPNNITSIKDYAFENCSSLTSVTIGNSVTSISSSAFLGCSGLSSVVWNAKNCNDLSSNPFASAVTSFTLGDEVEHIPAFLCEEMSQITSINIPNSVTTIGDYAFVGCSSLTSVTFGNSVTSIGSRAFQDCSSLTTVVWNAKNCNDFSSRNTPFYFYNSNNGFDLRKQITSLTFGDEVEHIPAYLCYGMSNLLMATIPNSATSIGNGAFSNCSGLTSLAIPNGVTSIGDDAFTSCSNMTQITIPEGVRYIGSNAFALCYKLSEVQIPNSVTEIGYMTFWMCESLQSIVIPDNVTAVGNEAFYYCSALESITFGKGLTYFGDNVLMGCSKLKDVVWKAIRCQDFTDINTPFYYYQPKTKTQKAKVVYDIRAQITSFTFGDEVEYVPAYLCSGMVNAEITIKNCKTEIGTHALDNCDYNIEGVYNIVLPDTTLCYNEELIIDGVQCNLQKTPNGKQIWTRNLTTIDGCDSIISISVLWKRVAPLADFNFTIKDAFDTPNSGSISWTVTGNTDYKYDYYTLNGNKYSNSSSSRYNLSAGEYKLVFYNEACNDSTIKYITINQLGIKVNNQYYLLDEENHTATLTYRGTSSSDYSNEYSGNITIPQVVTYSGVEYKVIGINNSTFSGCNKIKTVTLESSTPLSMNYSGLSSNTIVYVPFGSLNAYKAAPEWSNYTLHVIDPTHASATTGATSATITLGDSNEALYIASCGIIDGEATDGNVLEYIGLEPNSTYANLPLYINSTKGDYDTLHYSFTTSALELTTQQSKAISSTTAILLAETNMSDAEVNCGFEWKRENAPDAMAGTKVYCPVANGTMAGRLKGLKDDVYYKYRAFYQSTAGNTYYGDWQYIFTGDDAVEFDPVMYTYAASAVTETEATLKGYALAGSDEFTEQGFEYWAESRVIPEGANHTPARAYQNAIGEHLSVQATGISMKVTLTNLDEGTVYKYRTYAVVNGAKVYGSEMSFTTRGEYLYTVTFVDYDGTILGSDKVHYGTAATAPEDPSRGGYNFSGWDKDYSNVTDDLIVTAQYTVSTALPQATTDSSVQKFIRDGQLFIQKSGKTYTIQGVEVK